jgi:hypothetical protein
MPIVFRTAPPHPALKASMTIAPFAVGGPEARIKGFGNVIPKIVVCKLLMHQSSRNFLQQDYYDHEIGTKFGHC